MGHGMGLGKSRQTVVATCLAAGASRVLVVCPASLRPTWERAIRMIHPDASIGMVGEDRMATLRACDWRIGNHEGVGGAGPRDGPGVRGGGSARVHGHRGRAELAAFASLPWPPALTRQAEDRAYRLGKRGICRSLCPSCPARSVKA